MRLLHWDEAGGAAAQKCNCRLGFLALPGLWLQSVKQARDAAQAERDAIATELSAAQAQVASLQSTLASVRTTLQDTEEKVATSTRAATPPTENALLVELGDHVRQGGPSAGPGVTVADTSVLIAAVSGVLTSLRRVADDVGLHGHGSAVVQILERGVQDKSELVSQLHESESANYEFAAIVKALQSRLVESEAAVAALNGRLSMDREEWARVHTSNGRR